MIKAKYISHEAHSLREVVMCSPKTEYFLVANKQKHNITEIANKRQAIEQHQELVAIIKRFGATVLEIKEMKGHPNSVFTKDTAVVTPNGYIKLQMGIQTREDEENWMSSYLNKNYIPCIGTIDKPGKVEGGDIILAGNVAFLGISSRTNKEGAGQLIKILEKEGFKVRVATVPQPFLHLGGAMSVVDQNSVLSVKDVFNKDFFTGFKNIQIPNEGFISGNVITLGKKELIVNKNNLEAINKLKDEGYIIHKVNLDEFDKGTGGPSCLIMPLKRALF